MRQGASTDKLQSWDLYIEDSVQLYGQVKNDLAKVDKNCITEIADAFCSVENLAVSA